MPTHEEKARRKVVRNALRAAEREAIKCSLPASPEDMLALFAYLDSRLGETTCDHTLTFTTEYLTKSNLNQDAVIRWLQDAGGFCDCEVLFNVVDKFEIAYPPEK